MTGTETGSEKIAERMGAGLGPGGLRTMYVLGTISAAKALALIVFAEAIARGVVAVIAGNGWRSAVAWAVGAALARAALVWLGSIAAARSAAGAKQLIRTQLADRLMESHAHNVGSVTTLATHDLDELDEYYGTVLPALTNAAVIPLLVGARILFADWISALVIVLTVPLIPVFMTLVGRHTSEKVADASRALGRLSDHLVELAKGLPVLVGLGRVDEQSASLKKISDEYRTTTLVVLRTAFLSSLVLELISTISVAVVAVFVGLRLLNGSLSLEAGLLVLILAPECFAPFRELGSAFHASQNGLDALRRARAILASTPTRMLRRSDADADAASVTAGRAGADRTGARSQRGIAVSVDNLTVRFADRDVAAVSDVSFALARGEISALVGPSGSGKSTILAVLAGRCSAEGESGESGEDDPTRERRANGSDVIGQVSGYDLARVAWVPQHPMTVADTARGELEAYGSGLPDGLLSARIAELATRLELWEVMDSDPAQLSPGEIRRLAVARALLRVDAGAELLLLDEPTAHLDERNARAVEAEIAALRGRATVLLASHDPATVALATHRILLEPTGRRSEVTNVSTPVDAATHGSNALRLGAGAMARVVPAAVPSTATPTPTPTATPTTRSHRSVVLSLARFLRPAAGRYAIATLLGALSGLFAAALIAVSGWLIVRASEDPAIMFLLVAIVGVRFFGVGRSVLAYGQQLVTHDAIFTSIGVLRLRLWAAIAQRGTASRALLRPGNTVDYLVVTVDRIRDLAPRVVIPVAVGLLVSVASIITVGLLHAPALGLLLGDLFVCLVVAPAVAIAADRRASRQHAAIHSELTRRFAALIGAADDLRANGVDAPLRADLAAADERATRMATHSAWATGAGRAIVVFASCATVGLMLAVSAPAVHAGTLPPAIIAVLALLPLGLMEPLRAVVDAAQLWPTLAAALRDSDEITAQDADADAQTEPARTSPYPAHPIRHLELDQISARWPGAEGAVFAPVSAAVDAGDWLVVQGPSGSGKSTLITVLLGYLRPETGRYLVDANDTVAGIDPASLRTRLAWAPQDAHLFDSSIRGNLLLARSHEAAPSDAELTEVIRQVGLGELLESLHDGLDTRVGSDGSSLSGGQRQRLAVARALLTRADVLLLDEPTAHLDQDAARSLLRDLRKATEDRIAVLVTHRADEIRDGDALVVLGSAQFDTAEVSAPDSPGAPEADNARTEAEFVRM